MRLTMTLLLTIAVVCACTPGETPDPNARERIAIAFLEGLYAGDTSVVDRYAGDDIVISYPVFEQLFGTPTIEGREAVRNFSARFASRWVDGKVSIHETVTDGDTVVLVWGFSARDAASDGPAAEARTSWGGITVYRFDADDRIVLELGEESDPGPASRVAGKFPER